MQPKRKILFLAAADGLTLGQSGGAGTHMRGVINGFRENGFEVLSIIAGDVFTTVSSIKGTSLPKNNTTGRSFRDKIKVLTPDKIRLALRDIRTILRDYKLERKTLKQIISFKPDFIYERAAYLSTYGTRLTKRLKIPHFIETDGCMVEIISKDYGVFSKTIGNWVERYKLKRADYAVVMNKLAVDVVASKFDLNKKRFVVKTLGVEPNDFLENDSNEINLVEKYNLQNKFVVGFVGAISSYHGVNYLIEAAKHLGKSDVIIMIVGWSKEGELLYKKVKERELNNVIFTGKVDKSQIADYYKLFHVGVIPDSEESIYPVKVLEYGVFGVCPLVPDYEVFRELIIPNQTGYFFSPRDPVSMAQIISKISNEKGNVHQSGINWGEFVKNNFKWKDSVREIVNIAYSYDGPSSQ